MDIKFLQHAKDDTLTFMAAKAGTLVLSLTTLCLPAVANVPARASLLLSETPHQGGTELGPASHRGLAAANALIATGFGGCLCDEGRRSRSTGKERDAETGLDYFGARYFSGAQGRFTSPDAPFADQVPSDPQSWNLYTYVGNNPLRHVDETGQCFRPGGNCIQYFAGAAKSVGNIPSDIINTPNRVANTLISPFTNFRFNDLVPQTFQASNADQREGMEAAGVAMVAAPVAEAGVTKLLDVLGTGAGMESGVVAGITPEVGEAGGPGAGKPFPISVKDAARAESGNTCVFCEQNTQRTAGPAQSNIYHAIPKSRGGNNTLPNAQNTCRTCNLDKGTRTTREYEDELRRRQQN